MSAAIVKYWWENSPDAIDNNNDKLDFIGYNYGQPIPDLSEYDKVIMVDISFPKDEMIKLWDRVGVDNMIWIDHHISAIKDIQDTKWLWEGKQDTNFAACELTWKYFRENAWMEKDFIQYNECYGSTEYMPVIVRLLGLYDSFRHKGTEEEQKVLEFQYGARQCISNYEEAYKYLIACKNDFLHETGQYFDNTLNQIYDKGKAIYQYLCKEAQQTYKNGFEIQFYWTEPKDYGNLNNPKQCNAKFICINKERFNPINFGIDYHKDGYDGCACFHYDGKQWCFSLYNDNGFVDCSIIAKQYGGGGHKGAAGFRLSFEEFNKLINHK